MHTKLPTKVIQPFPISSRTVRPFSTQDHTWMAAARNLQLTSSRYICCMIDKCSKTARTHFSGPKYILLSFSPQSHGNATPTRSSGHMPQVCKVPTHSLRQSVAACALSNMFLLFFFFFFLSFFFFSVFIFF